MASKRRQRRRACEGKIPHASEQAAHAALWRLQNAGKARPGTRVYRCPFGNHWHVGTRPGRLRSHGQRSSVIEGRRR
jgi:hypothetical protein